MIVDKERIRLASTNFLFKGISDSELRSVIKPKNFHTVEEGTIIYRAGDETSEIFLIVEGEVKIKFSETRKVDRKCILDFFGEDEVLKDSKRVSSAVANKNTILYKISLEELKQLTDTRSVLKNNLNREENVIQDEYNNFIQPGSQQDNILDFSDGVFDEAETINNNKEE